jgi:hypothetical protein
MAYTQAQIDAFELAVFERKGARSFTEGDQTVQFASWEEAEAFLAYMKRNVITSSPTPRTRFASLSKGI